MAGKFKKIVINNTSIIMIIVVIFNSGRCGGSAINSSNTSDNFFSICRIFAVISLATWIS